MDERDGSASTWLYVGFSGICKKCKTESLDKIKVVRKNVV